MSGGDAETTHLAGAFDHAFLQSGYGGIADFYCQIATRHHDAVGSFNDFVQIFNRFDAFDFGYQARFYSLLASFVDQTTGGFHVFSIFDKADGQIVAADAHCGFQIAEVFFGKRAGREAAALFVDAFIAFQQMAVVGHSVDFAADHFFYRYGEQAVVQQ